MLIEYLLVFLFVLPMISFACFTAVMTLRLEVAKNDNCN